MHVHKHIRLRGPNRCVRRFLCEALQKWGTQKFTPWPDSGCAASHMHAQRCSRSSAKQNQQDSAPRSQLETPWPGSPSCCRQETRSINFSQQPDSLTQAARPFSAAQPHSDPPPSFQASKFSAPRSSTLTKETCPHGRARGLLLCLFRELRLCSLEF